MAALLLRGILLLVFPGLVPVACCDAPFFGFLDLQQITLNLQEVAPGSSGYISDSRTSAPELKIEAALYYNLVAALPTGASPFAGRAMATSPCNPEYGGQGFKDKATTVTLTSTGLFNGVAAGQPLDQFVRCEAIRHYHDTVAVPLSHLADSLTTWVRTEPYTQLALYLSPKPRDNARQQFELRIKLASGREIAQLTPEILWE